MPFLRLVGSKRAKLERDRLKDRGGGLRDRRGGVWGGSVICILKMVEFLAGFVFYFYLCGDLS